MNIKSVLIILSLISLSFSVIGQSLDEYVKVDKYKLGNTRINVFFNDPIINLKKSNPDFDRTPDSKKFQLVSEFLHNNPLYVFVAKNKKLGIEKSYILRGNPSKQRTRYYFQLDIVKGTTEELSNRNQYSCENTIDKINVGGSLFEHMVYFQTPEGEKFIGKNIKFWDYFTKVEPYEDIKHVVSEIIELDITNKLPEEILFKPQLIKEGLFQYQRCGIEKIEKREMEITVFRKRNHTGFIELKIKNRRACIF
jgi:hypothetical protein